MSEWIAKHPDELPPGLYVPVQALQEAEARVEELEHELATAKRAYIANEPEKMFEALAATEREGE